MRFVPVMDGLPTELCLHIAGYLDLASLTRLRATSRRWNALADHEARVHPRPEHPRTSLALLAAARDGRLESVKHLVEVVRADVHFNEDWPLRWTVAHGHLDVVKYLVETAGADIHTDNGHALRFASWNGHLEIVKYLIESAGADVHAGNDVALHWAAFDGHLDVVKYLVEVAGADVRGVTDETRLVTYRGHLEVVRYLESRK